MDSGVIIGTAGLTAALSAGLFLPPSRAAVVNAALVGFFFFAIAAFLGVRAASCWDCGEGGLSNTRGDFFVAWIVFYGPLTTVMVAIPLSIAVTLGIVIRILAQWLRSTMRARPG